jgi:hypothetical protein
MNQDIRDALARLNHAIESSAQAHPPTDAEELATTRAANARLRERLKEQEEIVRKERARADKAEQAMTETYAHWRDARGAELLLVRNDLEETRRGNRGLLEDQANLLGRLHAVERECAGALVEKEARVSSPREPLAAYAHEAWAAYMDYFLKKCEHDDGSFAIPHGYHVALRKQIATPYADLPEAEKDSDRAEADKMIAIMRGQP